MLLKLQRILPAALVALILGGFVAYCVFLIGEPDRSLSRQNDGFFYAAEAVAQRAGATITPPVFSTLTTAPANLYLSYTWLLSHLIPQNVEWRAILERIRLIEVFMVGLLACLIFILAYDVSGSMLASLLGFIAALTTAMLFRLTLDRPEAVTALFFLLMVWALIRRKYVPIALLAFLFPLTYSVSIVLLAPAFIYSFSAFVYGRVKALKREIPLTLTALLATILGIAVHPHAINYFFNGTWLHLNVFFNTGGLLEASEMLPPKLTAFEWSWIFVFLSTLFICLRYLYKKRSVTALPFPAVFLTILVSFLCVLYLHSLRFSNFLFPTFGLWVALIVGSNLIASKRVAIAYQVLIAVISLCGLFVGIRSQYDAINNEPPLDYYKNVAMHLSKHPGITLNRLDAYPPIIFFNHGAQLSSGRDNVFMAAYDRNVYDLYFKMGAVTPQAVLTGLKATYILDDGRNKRFAKYLADDKCLTATFSDPAYPQVKLYTLSPSCKTSN